MRKFKEYVIMREGVEASNTDNLTQQEAIKKFMPIIQAKGEVYHKKGSVLARPAEAGEVIHTITSDGKETTNTANEGDIVVKNQTEAGEEYILPPAKFNSRYKQNGRANEQGWTPFKATGMVQGIEFQPDAFGMPKQIQFMAVWNQLMVLKAGDMIVTPLPDADQVYRIAKKEFEETYG